MRVRPATPRDAPVIARALGEGLGDKYGPAFGPDRVRALEAIVRATRSSWPEGYRVAVDERDEVLGVAFLGLDGSGAPIFGPVSDALGIVAAIRASLVLLAFAKGRTGPDEAHLDELVVMPGERRRGVGSMLVADCERAAAGAGKRRLTLWVTGDNAAAQALYRGMGFRVTRRLRWLSGRVLFGARGALLMERSLDPEGPAPQAGAR